MGLQVRRSKNMVVDTLRVAIDTKEDFFEWRNLIHYSEAPRSKRLLHEYIDINAKLALELYNDTNEDIDIDFLQSEWNGENLEYLFTHARELFNFNFSQLWNYRSRPKVKISNEFAEMLISADQGDNYVWDCIVRTRMIPIEILLKHVHESKGRWRAILADYHTLGDKVLEENWEEIKEYIITISAYQKMSLEFMKAHEDEIKFDWYATKNKYMTEEILLYFKDKFPWSYSMAEHIGAVSEEFLEAITPDYVAYSKAYYWAYWFIKDEEVRNRLLLKYAAHLDDRDWIFICSNGFFTKEVIENFKDIIAWENMVPSNIKGDNSYFWELMPKEYYNNPNKWNDIWLWEMPIDHYLEYSKKDEVLSGYKLSEMYPHRTSDDIKKLYKANKIDFYWPEFIYEVGEIDVDTIRKNLKQFLFWMPGRLNHSNIDPVLELIRTGEINVDNCPLLTTKVNIDILIKELACAGGVFRFFAKYGTKTYTAIDILKEYQVPETIDALEDIELHKDDIVWFLNRAASCDYLESGKDFQKFESYDNPDMYEFIVD